MWKLKDPGLANKLKRSIESMNGRVPSLVSAEAGTNFVEGDAACDLVLISIHKSRTDLDMYQDDPVHGEIKKLIGPAAVSRHVVDFETDEI